MSTQAQPASDIKPTLDVQTPVIIKTGGTEGEGDAPLPLQCTIGVQDHEFQSRLLDHHWQSAMSAQTAKIREVIITDGSNTPLPIMADSPGLAVVQISIGNETLIVQEVVVRDSVLTRLSISSSIPFTATPGEAQDEWSDSTADLPQETPFVVFTQGDRMESVTCTSINVQVSLKIDWEAH